MWQPHNQEEFLPNIPFKLFSVSLKPFPLLLSVHAVVNSLSGDGYTKQITVNFLQVQKFPRYFSSDIREMEENKASLLIFKPHGSSTSTAAKQWHSLKKDQGFIKITKDKLLQHVWELHTVALLKKNLFKPQKKPNPIQYKTSDKLMHSIWQPGLALFNWRDKKTQVLKYSHWKDDELRNM